jgi:hypothetical protein
MRLQLSLPFQMHFVISIICKSLQINRFTPNYCSPNSQHSISIINIFCSRKCLLLLLLQRVHLQPQANCQVVCKANCRECSHFMACASLGIQSLVWNSETSETCKSLLFNFGKFLLGHIWLRFKGSTS